MKSGSNKESVVSKIEKYFTGILLLVITFLLFINVILRRMGMSIEWAEEFARYGIVWVTFIGSSICIYKGSHIAVDAILMLLNDKNKKILNIITLVISIIFIAFFTIYATKLTHKVYVTKQVSATLEVSMAYIYGAMPVGGVLMLIRYLQQLCQLINEMRGESQ
ncbi:TRAP transporter small permease [Clostridium sp. Cult3]|uniref:TRAP transporter small permease n=1 Tax=Clostridium sp. Cult3 TaxID=2079004 RepID=UPI001F3F8A13|nr:TRAP transporter small permease [Clostridium sp. Cult3]MCF6460724.1 hypothetical protein [Clostridium sp. Cult3]